MSLVENFPLAPIVTIGTIRTEMKKSTRYKKYIVDEEFLRWFFASISRWLNRDDIPCTKGDFEDLICAEISRVVKQSLKRKMYGKIKEYKEE